MRYTVSGVRQSRDLNPLIYGKILSLGICLKHLDLNLPRGLESLAATE